MSEEKKEKKFFQKGKVKITLFGLLLEVIVLVASAFLKDYDDTLIFLNSLFSL